MKNIETKEKGSFRCGSGKCLCCREIQHGKKKFKSTKTNEEFTLKFHLNCQTQYVVDLIECGCGIQYIGRTVQKLNQRLNKNRNNIKKSFQLHSVSRHMTTAHPENPYDYTIIPIDCIPSTVPNRFEALKKREAYWMYKLDTLKPHGLNEMTEMIY